MERLRLKSLEKGKAYGNDKFAESLQKLKALVLGMGIIMACSRNKNLS